MAKSTSMTGANWIAKERGLKGVKKVNRSQEESREFVRISDMVIKRKAVDITN